MSFVMNLLAVLSLMVIVVFLGIFLFLVYSFMSGVMNSFRYSGMMNKGSGTSIVFSSYNTIHREMTKGIKGILSGESRKVLPIKKKFKLFRKPDQNSDSDQEQEDLAPQKPAAKLYAITYKGDLMGSQNGDFSECVTAVLSVIDKDAGDQVAISIESGGGAVPAYGLASSQIERLKSKGIKVTACVDKIAASGGYMMASVADRIVCAPFAIVGSIGVVSGFPNYHKLLDTLGVSYKEYTAGKFKRTVSSMSEITEEKEKKFIEQLESTHELFKDHILANRPNVDIDAVATGEHWYGKQAVDLGLVDEIGTSDDWLISQMSDFDVYLVGISRKKTLKEKLSEGVSHIAFDLFKKITTEVSQSNFH